MTPICTHRCQSPKYPKYSRTVLLSTLYQSNVYTQTFQQKKKKKKRKKTIFTSFLCSGQSDRASQIDGQTVVEGNLKALEDKMRLGESCNHGQY